MRRRFGAAAVLVAGMTFVGAAVIPGSGDDGRERDGREKPGSDRDEVKIGLSIAPVGLHYSKKDRDLVGLGSYIVNAQGGCNDCHTWPNYSSDPFLGQQKQVNTVNYLAGGRPFGPGLASANITPDKTSGRPANLTLSQFLTVIRHGTDPDDPSKLLQVMPWPVYQDMSQHDLEAIYAYLSAIPHAEPAAP